MKIFQKIKDLFKKEQKIEEKPAVAEIPVEKEAESIGVCAICGKGIFENESSKKFQSNLIHKRCFKRVKKEALSGKNPFNIALN